jgi:hypothetical protein
MSLRSVTLSMIFPEVYSGTLSFTCSSIHLALSSGIATFPTGYNAGVGIEDSAWAVDIVDLVGNVCHKKKKSIVYGIVVASNGVEV